jgi:nucleoside-diphosphate-sugar epimerase
VWLWTILVKGVSCRPYNVGSEESISIGDLAASVSKAWNCSGAPKIAKSADPSRSPQRYVPATRRAAEELDLKSTVPLDDALRRTAEWYRATGMPERSLSPRLPSAPLADPVRSNQTRLAGGGEKETLL